MNIYTDEQRTMINQVAALESFMDQMENDLFDMGAMESAGSDSNPGTDYREAAADMRACLADGDERGAREAADRMDAAADEIEEVMEEDPKKGKKMLMIAGAAVAAVAVVLGVGQKTGKIDTVGALKTAQDKVTDSKVWKGVAARFKKKDKTEAAAESLDPSYLALMGIDMDAATESYGFDPAEELAALEAYIDDICDEAALESAMSGIALEEDSLPGDLRDDGAEVKDALADGNVSDANASLDDVMDDIDEINKISDPDKKKKALKVAAAVVASIAVAAGATAVTSKIREGEVSVDALKAMKNELKQTFKNVRKDVKAGNDKDWAKKAKDQWTTNNREARQGAPRAKRKDDAVKRRENRKKK